MRTRGGVQALIAIPDKQNFPLIKARRFNAALVRRTNVPLATLAERDGVSETNDTASASKSSTSRAKSASDRVSRSTL